MDALLPTASPIEPVATITLRGAKKRKRVGFFSVSATTFFSQVNAATARVLSADGWKWLRPPEADLLRSIVR